MYASPGPTTDMDMNANANQSHDGIYFSARFYEPDYDKAPNAVVYQTSIPDPYDPDYGRAHTHVVYDTSVESGTFRVTPQR